jgi:outer membrane receptor for Fe3+-dicitrate
MSAVPEAAVEAVAKAKYERYDSHFTMPGGLSWDEYVADDPSGADTLYRAEARADLEVAAHLIAAAALREAASHVYNGAPSDVERGFHFQSFYNEGVAHWLTLLASDAEYGVLA